MQGRNGTRGKKQVGTPVFETEFFRKQMYCIEESTCDIVGTFRRPPQWFGVPIVTRRLGNWAPLVTPLVKCVLRPGELASQVRFGRRVMVWRTLKTMKRSGDSTHNCRSPTPMLSGCDLTPSTRTQSSERKYSYLMASRRNPSTLYSRNTPQSFSQRTRPYKFPKSTKHVYTSLSCPQNFSKICWRVEICSVVPRPWRKSRWVSTSFGSIIFAASWHTLVLGRLSKEMP